MKQVVMLAMIILCSCQKSLQLVSASSFDLSNRKKPNVIIVLVDDIGFEVPTVDGGESYQTPCIDELAGKSLRFTQAYSCPLCSPSRIELLTGKYNFRNYTHWGTLDTSQKTLANLMR